MAEVLMTDVEKVYADGTRAVTELNLRIDDGHLLVIVGPSGCGKTTALRMVAGLEEISSGTIHIGGREVNRLDPGERDVAMVFQNYALYPHMTVYGNIAFPLRLARMPKAERDTKVRATAKVLGLESHLQRKPPQLSGGQRQRVAMGRAIVREPSVFLMDEPLSNLDAKLRVQMRAEISTIQRQFGVTTLYVTHDQVEAMTIGDRVAVMRKSRLQQVADPQTIYDHPANLFVASFVGSPAMNLFQASVERSADGFQLAVGERRIRIDEQEAAQHPGLAGRAGGRVVAGVRPGAAGRGGHRGRPPAARHGAAVRGARIRLAGLRRRRGRHGAERHPVGAGQRRRGRGRGRGAGPGRDPGRQRRRPARPAGADRRRRDPGARGVPRRAVLLRPGDRRGPRLAHRSGGAADPRTISSGGVATTTCPTWAPLIIVRIMSTERLPSSASGIRTVVSGGFR